MTTPLVIPLGDLFAGRATSAPIRPHLDAQAEELRQLCARYLAPCPFKPGDLVTPRKSAGLSGDGEPHVVVEVIEGGLPSRWTVDRLHGFRLDVRVGFLAPNAEFYALGWFESWAFEPYTGPVLAPEPAPASEPGPLAEVGR